ncbi:MAG: DUF1826 domain-containing protein [Pseudomonadota bacterium]
MSVVTPIRLNKREQLKSRQLAVNDHPSIFADIYKEDINIAIWQRELSVDIKNCTHDLLQTHSNYQTSLIATPDTVLNKLIESESELNNAHALCKDIAELVEMFCVLFGLEEAGLRLTTLDRAMCPRFHVDWVPCRLICTYHGVASEWLPHETVDRNKLGQANNGLADEDSGLYNNKGNIKQLRAGYVAMLKGERWDGNAGAGLVHRSPQVPSGENRLLLTLDFIS